MKMTRNGIGATILVASFSTISHANVVIDDFTGGYWQYLMGGFETSVSHTENGLGTNHTLFGMRALSVQVEENLFNLPVEVRAGDGFFQVAPQSMMTTWTMQTRYDDPTGIGMDLSAGDQFWLFGQPQLDSGSNVRWGAIDNFGRQAFSLDLVKGNGYYYTKKSFFHGGGIDWSHITTFLYKETYVNNYAQWDLIELAPEPNEVLSLGGFLCIVMGVRARRRRIGK